MHITGGLCEGHMALCYMQHFKKKSIICSGSWVTNSTVMKLHGSDNRGGTAIKTCTKSTCSHIYGATLETLFQHGRESTQYISLLGTFNTDIYIYIWMSKSMLKSNPQWKWPKHEPMNTAEVFIVSFCLISCVCETKYVLRRLLPSALSLSQPIIFVD